MNLEDFKFFIRISVRFSDVDMMGHVNNARYATYFEEARIHYASEVLGWQKSADALGMILARTEVNYLRPLSFGDSIRVYVRCSKIGTKSFVFSYVVVDEETQEMISDGQTLMVAFDYSAGASVPVDSVWKDAILAYEAVAPELN